MSLQAMSVVANVPDLEAYQDTVQMLSAMASQGAKVSILTANAGDVPGVSVIPLGRRGFRFKALDWLIAHEGCLDIVHDTMGHLLYYFAVRGPDSTRRTRLVTTQLTTNWGWFERVRQQGMALDWSYARQRLTSLVADRVMVRHADRVVVLGPGHESDLVAGHGVTPERVTWIRAESDLSFFTPQGSGSGLPRLLFTGNVLRNKGVDLLLRLASNLVPDYPELRLALVGAIAPWEADWLKEALAICPAKVELPGWVDKETLRGWYRCSDLYVFPSLFEGSPRTLREALACGLRAVVSELPGHRGVDPDGDFLAFAPVGDLAAFEAQVRRLLKEPPGDAQARTERALKVLAAHHTPSAVAASLLKLYDDLLTSPPRSNR